MNSSLTIGILTALGAGVAVGVQSIFVNLLGQSLSPVRGGLAIHIGGTIMGAIMVGYLLMTNPNAKSISITPQTILLSLAAGTTGMLIIIGIATAIPNIGYTAAQAIIIITQLGVSLLIDSIALTGGDPIPISARRIIGLVVVLIGTYLLLPQQSQ